MMVAEPRASIQLPRVTDLLNNAGSQVDSEFRFAREPEED